MCKNKNQINSTAAALSILVAGLLTGCQQDYAIKLLPAAGLAGKSACSQTLQTTQQNLRFLFMVDNSGSTGTTDPQYTYRVKTIQAFLGQYGSKTNFTYGFGMFSGSASLYDVSAGNFQAAAANPFGTAANLTAALNRFDSGSPGGNTAYNAAFTTMQAAITADESANKNHSNYVVVFMSDGMPTDVPDPVDANLISLVDKLRAAAVAGGSLLTLSSVYFGPDSDTVSIDHLQTMAKEGQGQFVDTNQLTGTSFSISDLITIPGPACSPSPAGP